MSDWLLGNMKTTCQMCGSTDVHLSEDFMAINVPVMGQMLTFDGIRVMYCAECGSPVAEVHDALEAANAAEAIECAVRDGKIRDLHMYRRWASRQLERPERGKTVLVHLAGFPEEEAIKEAEVAARGLWKIGPKYYSLRAVTFWSEKDEGKSNFARDALGGTWQRVSEKTAVTLQTSA